MLSFNTTEFFCKKHFLSDLNPVIITENFEKTSTQGGPSVSVWHEHHSVQASPTLVETLLSSWRLTPFCFHFFSIIITKSVLVKQTSINLAFILSRYSIFKKKKWNKDKNNIGSLYKRLKFYTRNQRRFKFENIDHL